MADYYPLIARAISSLEPGAPGEARRALYERARAALIAQLRGVQPPLTESEITRERLALEEAVRKVEAEAAQRSRVEPQKAEPVARGRPGDALRSSVRTRTPPPEEEAPRESRRPEPPAPPAPPPAPPEPPRRDRPRPPAAGSSEPRLDSPRGDAQRPSRGPAAPRRGADNGQQNGNQQNTGSQNGSQNGLRGFRDVVADANDLGGAAAQASRAARRTYANVPSPTPEFDRIEPSMEDRLESFGDDPYAYDELAAGEPHLDEPRPTTARPARGARAERAPKPLRSPSRFPLKSAIALGLVLVLAGAGLLLGPKLWSMVRGGSATAPQPVAEAPKAPAGDSAVKPKIADRVGQPGQPAQVAPIAQKVVLYDEDPADPQGKRYEGRVVWRVDQVAAANGQPPDVAVRADIEVPDRKLKMTLSIRRNTDASLPASHTAELTFTLPPDFAGGGVGNVPGILMKTNEQTKGTPLAGLAVKVTDGFFLIGLSNVEADRARNIALLKERSWFDIPLVYSNQRRAILAIEKGSPGERAFADAFAAWGQ